MTKQEAQVIRKYAEGAYPQMRQEQGADAVWIDMLADFPFEGIMQTLKDRIRNGNKYPPSIAELIGGYKEMLASFDSAFADWLEKIGYFDSFEKDEEMRKLNIRHRKEQTIVIMNHPMRESIMPDWLRVKYDEYQAKINQRFFAPKGEQKMIQGGN